MIWHFSDSYEFIPVAFGPIQDKRIVVHSLLDKKLYGQSHGKFISVTKHETENLSAKQCLTCSQSVISYLASMIPAGNTGSLVHGRPNDGANSENPIHWRPDAMNDKHMTST